MAQGGLEPPLSNEKRILNPSRLPIPPPGHKANRLVVCLTSIAFYSDSTLAWIAVCLTAHLGEPIGYASIAICHRKYMFKKHGRFTFLSLLPREPMSQRALTSYPLTTMPPNCNIIRRQLKVAVEGIEPTVTCF